jgi:hypothetical protein
VNPRPASYRHDPFGNTISKSGMLADANVYRFSSKEIHARSGFSAALLCLWCVVRRSDAAEHYG